MSASCSWSRLQQFEMVAKTSIRFTITISAEERGSIYNVEQLEAEK
jgi:hypothetical protein